MGTRHPYCGGKRQTTKSGLRGRLGAGLASLTDFFPSFPCNVEPVVPGHSHMRTVISVWFLYNEAKPVESCQSCKWTIHNLWVWGGGGGGANWGY